jgi:hypothetical protein
MPRLSDEQIAELKQLRTLSRFPTDWILYARRNGILDIIKDALMYDKNNSDKNLGVFISNLFMALPSIYNFEYEEGDKNLFESDKQQLYSYAHSQENHHILKFIAVFGTDEQYASLLESEVPVEDGEYMCRDVADAYDLIIDTLEKLKKLIQTQEIHEEFNPAFARDAYKKNAAQVLDNIDKIIIYSKDRKYKISATQTTVQAQSPATQQPQAADNATTTNTNITPEMKNKFDAIAMRNTNNQYSEWSDAVSSLDIDELKEYMLYKKYHVKMPSERSDLYQHVMREARNNPSAIRLLRSFAAMHKYGGNPNINRYAGLGDNSGLKSALAAIDAAGEKLTQKEITAALRCARANDYDSTAIILEQYRLKNYPDYNPSTIGRFFSNFGHRFSESPFFPVTGLCVGIAALIIAPIALPFIFAGYTYVVAVTVAGAFVGAPVVGTLAGLIPAIISDAYVAANDVSEEKEQRKAAEKMLSQEQSNQAKVSLPNNETNQESAKASADVRLETAAPSNVAQPPAAKESEAKPLEFKIPPAAKENLDIMEEKESGLTEGLISHFVDRTTALYAHADKNSQQFINALRELHADWTRVMHTLAENKPMFAAKEIIEYLSEFTPKPNPYPEGEVPGQQFTKRATLIYSDIYPQNMQEEAETLRAKLISYRYH